MAGRGSRLKGANGKKRGPKPLPFEARYTVADNGCWLWRGSTVGMGYGTLCVNGRTVRAHRHSYELYVGPIPKGLFVLHSCDNPGCVNPAHLFTGAGADNMQDCLAKGRFVNPGQKLSSAQLEVIRRSPPGTRGLAALFGVDKGTIRKARIGETHRGRPQE